MTTTSKLHLVEKYVDPIYGRIFEGWMSGDALNVYGALAHTHCAMSSSQAIAYKCAVEKRAFEASKSRWVDYNTFESVEKHFVVEVEIVEL